MRVIKQSLKRPRWLAMLLCVCIMLPYLNVFTFAAPRTEESGLCPHHPEHTESCGYAPARAESP